MGKKLRKQAQKQGFTEYPLTVLYGRPSRLIRSPPRVIPNTAEVVRDYLRALDPTLAGSVLQELVGDTGVRHALTEREMEVLRLLAHGRTNREIAGELVVSEETVKTHVGNILTKLHQAHRTQAVIHALKQGLISLDEIEI